MKKAKNRFNITLKKIKSKKKKEKEFEVRIDKKIDLAKPFQFEEPVSVTSEQPLNVRVNEKSWLRIIDLVGKFSALAAVLLALFIGWQAKQTAERQQRIIVELKDSLNAVLEDQRNLLQQQHHVIITTMDVQQKASRDQTDSMLQIIREQGLQMKKQNQLMQKQQQFFLKEMHELMDTVDSEGKP